MPIINQVVKGGGTTPTGTITITNNGVTDVTNYANADVQVPTTAPAHYIEKTVDANGKLLASPNVINLNGVTDIGDNALAYAYFGVPFPANTGVRLPLTTVSGNGACNSMFANCTTGLTSADLSALTTIVGDNACFYMFYNCVLTSFDLSALTTVSGSSSCQYMFNSCGGLTSANLPALTTVNGSYAACGSMFSGCYGLTSFDLSALTTVSGESGCANMFEMCSGLTSANLPALTTVSGLYSCNSMFAYCTGLTSANLPALTTVSGDYAFGNMFASCPLLATVYIGGTTAIDFGTTYTTQFDNMFLDCSQNIDVYAPAANQTTIEAMDGYPNFGGTGTVTWHWRS